MFHELSHIILKISGLCEINPDIRLSPQEQKIEVFCNKMAAEILMPTHDFIESSMLELSKSKSNYFSDAVISHLADQYGVSKEAIVRRLYTLNKVTRSFYILKKRQYDNEYQSSHEASTTQIKISPAKTVISTAGKPYCRLIINAINNQQITLNDASGYLNIRINQIPIVNQLIG